MTSASPLLFEPLRVGPLELPNRFLRSATYYALADREGRPTGASAELMGALARGGVGLIVTGFTYVARSGRCFADMNGLDGDGLIEAYRPMTQAAHEGGALVAVQLVHGGAQASEVRRCGEEVRVVSRPAGEAGEGQRELCEAEIEELVAAFGQAARRAREAGFDAVQLHAAHGYLVSQFLSPHSNRRGDRWGGDLEGRQRFALEVLRAMRREAGEGFPLMVKLGCRDYLDDGGGLTIEEGARVAAALEREGVCSIEVSHGHGGRPLQRRVRGSEQRPIEEGYLLDDARVVRGAVSIPLALVGGLRSLEGMQRVLAEGIELVSLCRPLIRQPDLIARWRAGSTERPECISCWGCLVRHADGTSTVGCRKRS